VTPEKGPYRRAEDAEKSTQRKESRSLRVNTVQDAPAKKRIRLLLIGGVTLAAIIAIALVPRVPQSEAYHSFADQRTLLGVRNLLNVLSNLAFLLVGIAGLLYVARPNSQSSFYQPSERVPYLVFFLGVTLTCFGSAYYHLSPNNDRLVWDRLPMTIAFMSLLSAAIAERISRKAGLVLLLPLLLIGMASVIYWHLSEQSGNGDLRPYILVQFYSALVIVLVVGMFPPRYIDAGELVIALILYALSKVLESLDSQVFGFGRIVSGHTLKHLTAALSVWFILHMLRNRTPITVALSSHPVAS
jgi:hypothetical protein